MNHLRKSDGSDKSDRSEKSDKLYKLLPAHGGYRRLRSFQAAQLAYDLTVIFCERHISRFSRTRDQMVQAARSGVQNIAEGSAASGTSKKIELKLTNVARASLEELLLDYEDYLRQQGLQQWPKNDPRILAMRRALVERSDPSDLSDLSDWSDASDESFANLVLCLINQASFLLGKQVAALERAFTREGGITERLYRGRKRSRGW